MLVRFYNPCHLDKISPDLSTFSDVPGPSRQPQEMNHQETEVQKGEQEYVCMAGMSQCGEEQVGVLSSA